MFFALYACREIPTVASLPRNNRRGKQIEKLEFV